MIAALILLISLATLLQFFVSYSHSLIAASKEHALSEQTREVTGISTPSVRGDDFKRLLQLIALCPDRGRDRSRIRTVCAYFNLLGLSRALFASVMPAAARWIESERSGCAYVVAVALDHRIAHSRTLMVQ